MLREVGAAQGLTSASVILLTLSREQRAAGTEGTGGQAVRGGSEGCVLCSLGPNTPSLSPQGNFWGRQRMNPQPRGSRQGQKNHVCAHRTCPWQGTPGRQPAGSAGSLQMALSVEGQQSATKRSWFPRLGPRSHQLMWLGYRDSHAATAPGLGAHSPL